ncbi:MAG TPA: hypothetical protein VFV66_24485 [Nonomuraea sp.]|nr:hypothetical protein [Nonomuraea sp.]
MLYLGGGVSWFGTTQWRARAAIAVACAVLSGLWATTVSADGPCGATGAYDAVNSSCTYATPGSGIFTVPSGVDQVNATVNGAQGAPGGHDRFARFYSSGGLGGRAAGTVAVGPGSVLTVDVGAVGGGAPGGGASGADCCPGVGGGQGGNAGGAGGGASSISHGSTAYFVGGGGGGGAGNGAGNELVNDTGRPGGNGGAGGGTSGSGGGHGGGGIYGGSNGSGGSQSAGGAHGGIFPGGGASIGASGGFRVGGAGGIGGYGHLGNVFCKDPYVGGGGGGGGGGAGWYGGGGGAGGAGTKVLIGCSGGGGGGGGGSSYVTPSALVGFLLGGVQAGHGSVTITWAPPPPSITGAPTTSPNPNGWYRADVGVAWSCAGNPTVACPANSTITGEGPAQSVSASVSNPAGTTVSATVTVAIDRTPPATTASLAGNAGQNGWFTTSTVLTLGANDALSGVSSTTYRVNGGPTQTYGAPVPFGEGSYVVSYASTDRAGNPEPARTVSFGVDATAPTIAGAPDRAANASGWYAAPVTVSFTCTDALAGVASCTPPTTLATDSPDAATAHSVTGAAIDNAGNSAQASVGNIRIDQVKPTINGAPDRAPNANGWYSGPVTVSFTCADALSGLASCTPDQVVPGEGTNLGAAGAASDKAGNTAAVSVGGLNVDWTAPTLVLSADRAANANGWYNAAVTVSATTCADALSGVAACPAPVAIAGEGTGQSVTRTVADRAGNTASASVSGIDIDLTAPVVTYSGNVGTYTVDQTVAIACAATDALSGVASTSCQNVAAPAYSYPVGDTTLSASATDKAGNTGVGSSSFTVKVTVGSLCALTRQFSTNSGVANGLCAKLEAAGAAAARGNTNAKAGQIGAYLNQLAGQSGKAFTAQQVAILSRLASAL